MCNRQIFFALIIFPAVIFSCKPLFAPLQTPPVVDLPQAFSLYPGPAEAPQHWWESFQDAELNALIETALTDSFGLQTAWTRLRQARAVAVRTGADLYPEVTIEGGTGLKRQRTDNGTQAAVTSGDTGSIGLVARYEIDLWGRVHSETEAARLEAVASREALHTAAVTVAAEVADRWIRIVAARMQKNLLDEQLGINRIYLDLVALRFRKGMVSALDVYQQRQIVEKVQAQIPLVEKREALLRHELALLLGKPAGVRLEITRDRLPVPEKVPAAGVPADLLANRPDVRSAGLKLRAAQWQVAAARANRLPSLSLRAGATAGPGDLDLVFDNWLLQLAANLAAPLLDGNRRIAEVDRTRAVVDENLTAYRQAVYTAVREVEDALVSEQKQRQHLHALEQQTQTARKALTEAREHYRKGLNTYLPVLTQLLTVQNLELDLIAQQTELVVNRIGLYRALGGTWPRGLAPVAGS